MSVEKNLKVIQAVDEASNGRDWEAFASHHTEDVVSYSPMRSEPTKGITAHLEAVQGLLTAFPDFKMTRDQSFGQGDWAYVGYILTGTHTGPLPGPGGKPIPPTNKPIKIPLGSALRFKNGKIAEEHIFFDRLDMLRQLGIDPL
ncbi:MAG: ester cyclase [Methanomassiliicoccales archaeon]|nr:MAG: ester cyclase [Methanomassiliicoccales archaeon]